MYLRRIAIVVLAVVACTCPPALANDGVASLGVGGVVLGRTTAIAMQREVLEIGWHAITVDYDFVNETDHAVTEMVMFPLPEYGSRLGVQTFYRGQPSDFQIEVDGRPVAYRSGVRAFLGDAPHRREVTTHLHKLGLSDRQIALAPFDDDHDALKGAGEAELTARQWSALQRNGLLRDGYGGNYPKWTVRVTYVWSQIFPPHRPLHVRHRYVPFVAQGSSGSLGSDELRRLYDADANFLHAYQRLERINPDPAYGGLLGTTVSYVLKTANSWKDGIRDFTLRIRKGRPEEIVTLRFPGKFRRVDATTLECQLKRFHPAQDLEVYFGNLQDVPGSSDGEKPTVKAR